MSIRAPMERRLAFDFGRVRVHRGGEAERLDRDTQAFTEGHDIYFAQGRYEPETTAGRWLLAHELAHVVQQNRRPTRTPASEDELEKEASKVADDTIAGRVTTIERSARPKQRQYRRVRHRGRTFEVGDVKLRGRASVDVRVHGVLFPGPDQAHVLVTGTNELGYEVAHTNPDDPFRWQRLKDIVDRGHVEIAGIGMADSFDVQEILGATTRTVPRSLIMLGAGGITLPTASRQRAIAARPVMIASTSSTHDQIYYESSARGRGILGNNSLAHELFGHLWLAMQGVAWAHGGQISAQQGILDPYGRPFGGSVNDYIDNYAGASSRALQSPTQRVSAAHLAAAFGWLTSNGAAGLIHRPPNGWSVSPDFGLQWEIISQNYEVLHAPRGQVPPAPATAGIPTLAGLLSDVLRWFGTLTGQQQSIFRSFLTSITGGGWSMGASRNTRLASDVIASLPSPATP